MLGGRLESALAQIRDLLSRVTRAEGPRAWLPEAEPEPGETRSLWEAQVPPSGGPISSMIPPSHAQQSLSVLNQVVYCDPSAWSEDRGSQGDAPVLIGDPEPLERAISMETHGSPRMCLPA